MENNKSLNVLKVLIFMILCFGSMEAFAVSKTWSGANGASFNDGANWTPAGVPESADDVTINTAGTVVINSDIHVNSITINHADAILRPSGSTGLDVVVEDYLELIAGSILYTNIGGTGELSWTFEGSGSTRSMNNVTAAGAQLQFYNLTINGNVSTPAEASAGDMEIYGNLNVVGVFSPSTTADHSTIYFKPDDGSSQIISTNDVTLGGLDISGGAAVRSDINLTVANDLDIDATSSLTMAAGTSLVKSQTGKITIATGGVLTMPATSTLDIDANTIITGSITGLDGDINVDAVEFAVTGGESITGAGQFSTASGATVIIDDANGVSDVINMDSYNVNAGTNFHIVGGTTGLDGVTSTIANLTFGPTADPVAALNINITESLTVGGNLVINDNTGGTTVTQTSGTFTVSGNITATTNGETIDFNNLVIPTTAKLTFGAGEGFTINGDLEVTDAGGLVATTTAANFDFITFDGTSNLILGDAAGITFPDRADVEVSGNLTLGSAVTLAGGANDGGFNVQATGTLDFSTYVLTLQNAAVFDTDAASTLRVGNADGLSTNIASTVAVAIDVDTNIEFYGACVALGLEDVDAAGTEVDEFNNVTINTDAAITTTDLTATNLAISGDLTITAGGLEFANDTDIIDMDGAAGNIVNNATATDLDLVSLIISGTVVTSSDFHLGGTANSIAAMLNVTGSLIASSPSTISFIPATGASGDEEMAGNGTITLFNATIDGTVNDVEINAASTVSVNGDLTLTGGNGLTADDGATLQMSGTTAQTIETGGNALALDVFTVSNSVGVTTNDDITLSTGAGNVTISGLFNQTSGTVTFDDAGNGAMALNTTGGTCTIFNLAIGDAGGDDLVVAGDLTVTKSITGPGVYNHSGNGNLTISGDPLALDSDSPEADGKQEATVTVTTFSPDQVTIPSTSEVKISVDTKDDNTVDFDVAGRLEFVNVAITTTDGTMDFDAGSTLHISETGNGLASTLLGTGTVTVDDLTNYLFEGTQTDLEFDEIPATMAGDGGSVNKLDELNNLYVNSSGAVVLSETFIVNGNLDNAQADFGAATGGIVTFDNNSTITASGSNAINFWQLNFAATAATTASADIEIDGTTSPNVEVQSGGAFTSSALFTMNDDDGTTGNDIENNNSINSSLQFNNLTIAATATELDYTGGFAVNGNLTQTSSGVLRGSTSSTLEFNGTNSTFTIDLNAPEDVTLHDVYINGTVAITAANQADLIVVGGDFEVTNSGAFSMTNGGVDFDEATTDNQGIINNGILQFHDFVLSQADQDDTLTVSDNFEINGSITNTDGTLMNVGNVVTLSGTSETITNTPNKEGELSFYSLVISGGYTLVDDMQLKGNITVSSGGSLTVGTDTDVIHMDSTGTKTISNAGTLAFGILNIGDYENNVVTTNSDFTIRESVVVGGATNSGESFTATGGSITMQEAGAITIIDNNTGNEGDLQFNNLIVSGVASVTQPAANSDFSVSGNITILNDADFDFQTNDTKITLNGSTQQTIDITGTGVGDATSGRFLGHDLTLNNSNGASLVGTTNDIVENQFTFQGTLRLRSGDIDLNGNNIITIDVALGGTLGENTDRTIINSGASTATGHVYATQAVGDAMSNVDFGGLAARITTDIDPGTLTIRRYHIARDIAGKLQASRYYGITSSVKAGLNAKLVFGYDDSELGTLTENDLILMRSTDASLGPWYKESSSINTSLNRLTTNAATGIDGFTGDYEFWTIGSPNEITGAEITEALASNPLASGTDDNNVFGIELSSTGSVEVETLRFNFGRILAASEATSFTLVYSDDDDLTTTGDNTELISGYSANGKINGATTTDNYVEFILTGEESKFTTSELGLPLKYFLLIDVNSNLTGSTSTITPQISEAELTVSGGIVDPFTIVGTNYSFLPSIEVEPNEIGLSESPLVAGSDVVPIFGFKAELTSAALLPGFNGFTLDFDQNPNDVFKDSVAVNKMFRFWKSTDDNFETTVDNTEIELTTRSFGTSDVTFGFAKQQLAIDPTYFFVTASVKDDVDESISSITPTMVYNDITSTDAGIRGTDGDGNVVASHQGFTYQIARSFVTVSDANNPSASTLGSNLADQTIFGFSVTPDNGQTVELQGVDLLVALSDNAESSNLDQWKLFRDANGNGYGDAGEQVAANVAFDINAEDDNLQFTSLTESISSETKYIVTVRPKSSITSGTEISVQLQSSDYLTFNNPARTNAGGPFPTAPVVHSILISGPAKALELITNDATVVSGGTLNALVRVVDANGVPTRVTSNTALTIAKVSGDGTLGGTVGYTITSGTGYINLAPTLSHRSVSTNFVFNVTDDAAGLTATANSGNVTILETAPSDFDGALTFGTVTTTTIPITNISAPTTAGDGRIIVVRQGAVPADPTNGVLYTPSTDIASAGIVGVGQTGPGSYVINSTAVTGAVSISTSGLMPNSRYYFKVFEFTGSGTNLTYSTGSNFVSETNRNPISVTTAAGDFASSDSLTPSNIQTDIDITSTIAVANDEDWFQFKLNGTNNNARVTISGLPANYNMQIYDASTGFASMALLRESVVTGNSQETVTINNLPQTGTYVIRVYGDDNEAFSATNYTLRVSTSANEFYSLTSE